MDTTEFVIVALGVAAFWLTCTVMGRYYLRRLAVGLLLIAAAVMFAVDYAALI